MSRTQAIIRMLKKDPVGTVAKTIKNEAKGIPAAFKGKADPWKWSYDAEGNAFIKAFDPKTKKYVGHFKNPQQGEAAYRRLTKVATELQQLIEKAAKKKCKKKGKKMMSKKAQDVFSKVAKISPLKAGLGVAVAAGGLGTAYAIKAQKNKEREGKRRLIEAFNKEMKKPHYIMIRRKDMTKKAQVTFAKLEKIYKHLADNAPGLKDITKVKMRAKADYSAMAAKSIKEMMKK